MKDLLNTYSVDEIVFFLVLFAIAAKEVINFIDWAKERLRKSFSLEHEKEKSVNDLSNQILTLSNDLQEIHDTIKENQEHQNKMQETINLLVESDKDDIKSWLTQQHHYWVYEKGFIDDYSLNCIEKRYGHYKDEGGNSFIEDLMKDLRELPKVSISNTINDMKK